MNKPLLIAASHQLLMRFAVIRFVVDGMLAVVSSIPSNVSLAISMCLGAKMAYYGYKCCNAAYGAAYGIIAALFMFSPFAWVLAVLILSGNISDKLYRHCGAVGLFGVTDEQLEKLRSAEHAGEARDIDP